MKKILCIMIVISLCGFNSCQKKEKVKEVACDVVELGSDLQDLLITNTEDVYGPICA